MFNINISNMNISNMNISDINTFNITLLLPCHLKNNYIYIYK